MIKISTRIIAAVLVAASIIITASHIVNAAEKPAVTKTVSVAKKTTTKVSGKNRGPAVDMGIHNTFFGYHGTRVDYKDLVTGKFYLMEIPKMSAVPTFKFCIVKIKGSYTNKGMFFDDVMVKYDKYNTSGKLIARNKKTQVNENLLNLTPNHFYEITDDIRVK